MTTKKRVRTPDSKAGLPAGAMMETYLYITYELRGITYLPHYHERVYVGLGYGVTNFDTYLGMELKALGARQVEIALWKRSHF